MPVRAAHELVVDALRAEVALAAAMQAGNLDRSSAAGESDVSRRCPVDQTLLRTLSDKSKAGVGQKLNKGQQILGGDVRVAWRRRQVLALLSRASRIFCRRTWRRQPMP